jgi:hypothetical protein
VYLKSSVQGVKNRPSVGRMSIREEIIIIIIIFIIIGLITLPSIYALRNYPSQTVGGIRLIHGKEIHPIP